jgi:hypothetical protein
MTELLLDAIYWFSVGALIAFIWLVLFDDGPKKHP